MLSPLDFLFGLFSLDIGIDLGTAYTLVYVRGRGIVINEPSFVAIDRKTRAPIEVGARAKEMWSKNPKDILIVRPLRDGVISEYEITARMLDYLIKKAHEQSWVPVPRPRVVVGIPSGVTEVEKRAVIEATLDAGAREAHLIEEPVAAAIGANLPVLETRGSMVVDIGGGTTEVALFSLGGIVISRSIRVAGDEMDEDIVQHLRNKHNLLIGEPTAEKGEDRYRLGLSPAARAHLYGQRQKSEYRFARFGRGQFHRDPRCDWRLSQHHHRHGEGRAG